MSNWNPKDPAESVVVDFDFSGVTLAINTATISVELVSGVDPTPEAILVGAKTIVGALVQQRVGVGIAGCRYRFLCTAVSGNDTFTLYDTLPVAYGSDTQGGVAVLDYTSYAEVRAALGISEDEVDDGVLGLPMYGNHLAKEFSNLEDDLALADDLDVTFSTLSAIAPATRTKAQKRVLSSLALFATYAVARHLGTSLPMMAPKSIGDGKATLTRFSDGPYKATLLQVESQYESAKGALYAALSSMNSTTAVAITTVFMGVSSPATDPVTGV